MARDPQALRQAEKELKNLGPTVLVVPGDATSEADVRTFAQTTASKLGPVRILVNNAGVAKSEAFWKTDRKLWESMFALNATSAFLVTKEFILDMAKRGAGRIVMLASIAA